MSISLISSLATLAILYAPVSTMPILAAIAAARPAIVPVGPPIEPAAALEIILVSMPSTAALCRPTVKASPIFTRLPVSLMLPLLSNGLILYLDSAAILSTNVLYSSTPASIASTPRLNANTKSRPDKPISLGVSIVPMNGFCNVLAAVTLSLSRKLPLIYSGLLMAFIRSS